MLVLATCFGEKREEYVPILHQSLERSVHTLVEEPIFSVSRMDHNEEEGTMTIDGGSSEALWFTWYT